MRDLHALTDTSEGRQLLLGSDIHTDPSAFIRRVKATADQAEPLPVYSHQQTYLDYRGSVVAKMLLLRRLDAELATSFVWIDTDRAASDALGLRMYWPGPHGKVAVRFAPPRCNKAEPRHILLDPNRLEDALRTLRELAGRTLKGVDGLQPRLDLIAAVLRGPCTLAQLSRALTDTLMSQTLRFVPEPHLVSDLVRAHALDQPVSQLLAQREELVHLWNHRIDALHAANIATAVRRVDTSYLPLFYNSPSGQRLRLQARRASGNILAEATDACGQTFSFSLGAGGDDLSHLHEASAGRNDGAAWSPDVALPILLAQRFGGMVAGRSSALYMMVLNPIARALLGRPPRPVLVPSQWDPLSVSPSQPGFDSLVHTYLRGDQL